MSDQAHDDDPPPRVGYRRPPIGTRFKKGQSGNPGGRPRKTGPVVIDMAALIDAPVKQRRNGRTATVEIKEVQLRAMVKGSLRGHVDDIAYCLQQFMRYEAIAVPKIDDGGAIQIPKTMPMRLGSILLSNFGRPTRATATGVMTWTEEELALARRAYLASRTDEERAEDMKIGYPDLDQQ